MDKTTKICATAIIIAAIWFLAQPIGGSVSVDGKFEFGDYAIYHAEFSGQMPIGTMIPVIIMNIFASKFAIFTILCFLWPRVKQAFQAHFISTIFLFIARSPIYIRLLTSPP